MLAQDILGNPDHVGSGYFLTKYDNTPDSKIKMANMWDFDDIFYESRRNQWSRLHTYGFYDALFKSPSRDFVNLYVSKWNNEGLRIIEEITNWLKDFSLSDDANALTESIAMDNGRWKVDNKDVKTCVDIAINNFEERKNWISNEISELNKNLTGVFPPIPATSPSLSFIYKLDGSLCYKIGGKGGYIIRTGEGEIKKIVK